MSWFARGLLDVVEKDLITSRGYPHNSSGAVRIIDTQIESVRAFKTVVPTGYVGVAECSGHADTYSCQAKVNLEIYKDNRIDTSSINVDTPKVPDSSEGPE